MNDSWYKTQESEENIQAQVNRATIKNQNCQRRKNNLERGVLYASHNP